MGNSLYQILSISRQDMRARLFDLDSTSNNLANINTIGYKRNRVNFQELLEEAQHSGTRISSTQIMQDQGARRTTSNGLDMMIQGEGFFMVQMPNDVVGYTRDGAFQLDADGTIVSPSGYPLIWDGEIPPETQEVQVQPNGVVYAKVNNAWEEAGTMQIARFTNPTALQVHGDNVYLETELSGEAVLGDPASENFGLVNSYSLEMSNVNMADEMTHLMTMQRAFQISVRTFQQTDTMMQQALRMRNA